jgi:hypothetical protein
MPDESFRRAEARPVIEEGAVAPQDGPTAHREPFERTGRIRTWYPKTRTLTFDGDEEFVLADHIPLAGVGAGVRVDVTGYRSPKIGVVIVTALRLT